MGSQNDIWVFSWAAGLDVGNWNPRGLSEGPQRQVTDQEPPTAGQAPGSVFDTGAWHLYLAVSLGDSEGQPGSRAQCSWRT